MNTWAMKRIGASFLRTRRCNDASDLPSFIATSNITLMGKMRANMTITNYNFTRRCFLSSLSKGSKPRGSTKKPRVKLSSPGSGSPEAMWCKSATPSSSDARVKSLEMGRYGLERLDYTTMKPPVWTAPPHPPTKTTAERMVFPISIAVAAGFALWVYMSPEEEDMTEYWKRVESGQILMYDDDDGDDDDDDDDDEV